MVDMFVEKMCNYCLNNNCNKKCNKKVEVKKIKNYTTYKCDEYIKDESKIVPYQEPILVTAERSYVTKREK